MFKAWPKIPRVENCMQCYTEKLDGTNACIICSFLPADHNTLATILTEVGPLNIWAQSRSRLITPSMDNYGFAKWVQANAQELSKLGAGYHYGEWWGLGIQRGYNQLEKKFSLFNTLRWNDQNPNRPDCVSIVPTIHAQTLEEARNILIDGGSLAAPGYMDVEGVVIYDPTTNIYMKSIIKK